MFEERKVICDGCGKDIIHFHSIYTPFNYGRSGLYSGSYGAYGSHFSPEDSKGLEVRTSYAITRTSAKSV